MCISDTPREHRLSRGPRGYLELVNSQSARNKVDLIGEAVIEHDIDILALTETWLTSTPKDKYYTKELSFSGYKLINVPRPGGGVAILHKDGLSAQTVAKTGAGYTTFEHCDVQFNNNSGLLNIIVVYRPPPTRRNGHTVGAFLDEFRSLLEDRMSSPGRLVILGDLNFHDLLNFSQHVTSITHKAGHTFDLVITHDSEAVIDNVTVSDLLSDHALVLLVRVKHPKHLPTRITTINRKLRGLDATSLAAEVCTLASKTFHTDASPDSIAEKYSSILAAALDKFAPCHTKTVNRRPSQPWYNDTLHEAKRRRRQAERTWRSTDLEVHRQIHRHEMTTYNKLCIIAKSNHYLGCIEEAGGDPKALNCVLKSIVRKDQMTKLPLYSSQDTLANQVQKIRDGLPVVEAPVVSLPPCNSELCVFVPVKISEVSRIVMKSSTKACALDPMPRWLLKELLPSIAPLMTDFINSSLQSGVVPDSMKSAAVTPLLKKPSLDINILKNYRPVSNLPFVSKVLERVVASQLKAYMDYNDLHDPLQLAYKTAHSTESALLKVQNDILRTVDHGGVAVLVLLDLSAAFGTIDHRILLDLMQHQLSWFESYLTGRTQRIRISDAWSLAKFLLYCVPRARSWVCYSSSSTFSHSIT